MGEETDSDDFSVREGQPRDAARSFGFRFGDRGTHTSRTIMLAELRLLLAAAPREADRATYSRLIVEGNVLGKRTTSTRALSGQRLGELYGLDPTLPLFRALRELWQRDAEGRPLLALLCALARDPLLRATVRPVAALRPGQELYRPDMAEALQRAVGSRLNEAVLDKVVRNASSSWVQSGHLVGRVRKVRQVVHATPVVATYALQLGYLLGLRGERLLRTLWCRALDATPESLLHLAAEAKRLGLLDLKRSGEVLEISFPGLLTPEERRLAHGAA